MAPPPFVDQGQERGERILRVGDAVTLRLRPSNQLVQGHILRFGWFRVLCSWGVRESWDGAPPFRHYVTSGWVRCSRIIAAEHTPKSEGRDE